MTASASNVTLVVDPPSHHFLGDRLFDPATNPLAGENILAPYIAMRDRLRAAGVGVHTADRLPSVPNGARHVYVSLGRIADYRALSTRSDVVLSAFFAIECPIVEPGIFRALPDIQRYVRRLFTVCEPGEVLRFTRTPVSSERYVWPQCADGVNEAAWGRSDRRFLCMINANKLPRVYDRELYTARLRAVEYFAQFDEVDLYGRDWDRAPWRLGRSRVPYTIRRVHRALWERWQQVRPHPLYASARRAWRGTVVSKAETLARYTFAICFENMTLQGWLTEKLFDCFYAGCVPIYWGAPDITDLVPADSFIDMRSFRDFAELRRFLHDLDPVHIQRYREAARAFIESPAYAPFRPAAFAERIATIVREDTGVDV